MPTDVGIVMPVYRQRYRFLRAAIKSVLNQSYKRFRLVIVLDGSPAVTRQQVRHLVRGDKRVRVITMPHNQGIAHALNRGFQALYRHSKIRYLTWVSSDNVYHEDFLYQLRHTIRRSGSHVGLVYSGFRFINDNSDTIFDEQSHQDHYTWMNQPKENLLDVCFIGASFLYKRRYAERTGPYRCEPVEDYEYWLRLTEHCDIRFIPTALMDYRLNSEYSVTRQLHGSGSVSQHRRWRYGYETAKHEARIRRGIGADVSVVVPFAEGVSEASCLESVFEQTHSNMEITVVDFTDGSSASRTARKIRDPRVKWIRANGLNLRRAVRLGISRSKAPLTMIFPAVEPLGPYQMHELLDNYHSGTASGDRTTLNSLRRDYLSRDVHFEKALYVTNAVQEAVRH